MEGGLVFEEPEITLKYAKLTKMGLLIPGPPPPPVNTHACIARLHVSLGSILFKLEGPTTIYCKRKLSLTNLSSQYTHVQQRPHYMIQGGGGPDPPFGEKYP